MVTDEAITEVRVSARNLVLHVHQYTTQLQPQAYEFRTINYFSDDI